MFAGKDMIVPSGPCLVYFISRVLNQFTTASIRFSLSLLPLFSILLFRSLFRFSIASHIWS